MVDAAGDSAGGGAGGLRGTVGYFRAKLPDRRSEIITKLQRMLDRLMPPERREDLWEQFKQFAAERPKMTAFILSHIALSGVPLGLFLLTTCTVALFAITTGLLVGLLGALFFITFATGFALVFLLPTLFFTTMAATFFFLWGVTGYYLLKWFNERRVPGIHVPLKEGMQKEFRGTTPLSEHSQLPALKPDSRKAESGDSRVPSENGPNSENDTAFHGERQEVQGHTTQSQPQSNANKAEKRQAPGKSQGLGGGPNLNLKSTFNYSEDATKQTDQPLKLDKPMDSVQNGVGSAVLVS